MLSVNYISNFLNNKQTKIGSDYFKSLNNFESKNIIDKINDKNCNSTEYTKIPDELKYFFNTDINNFSINEKIESKNEIFCFFSSLMIIGDSNFLFYNYKEKRDIIKNLIKKMNDDLFLNDLYYKFNYTKNKYFNKEKLLKVLIDGYNFKIDENINLLKKYACDYLGINAYIIQCSNDKLDFNYKEYYLSNKYSQIYNDKLPHYFILKDKDCYYPILTNNNKCENFLDYESFSKYLNKFESFFELSKEIENIKHDCKEIIKNIKKMKIEDLRNECKKYDIDITKLSEKTNRPINKLKNELLDELLKVI